MRDGSKLYPKLTRISAALLFSAAPSVARACDAWDVSGPFRIAQSNKLAVSGTFEQVGNQLKGKASYFSPTLGDHGTQLEGDITGTVDGSSLQFSVAWYGTYVSCSSECVGSNYNASGTYEGSISPDGHLSGLNWAVADPGHKVNWSATAPAACRPATSWQSSVVAGMIRNGGVGKLAPVNPNSKVVLPPSSVADAVPRPIDPNSKLLERPSPIANSVPSPSSHLGPPLDESLPVPREGTYDTTFGTLTLRGDSGSYSYKEGKVTLSRVEGNYAEGMWEQSASGRQCPDGRYYGRLLFQFTKAGFVGKFGYCDDDPTDRNVWNGTRVSGEPARTNAGAGGAGAMQQMRHVDVATIAPRRVAFRPKLLEVRGGERVPFQPFPMVDPSTGRPLDPDAVITFPRGETAVAGKYFAWLNRFEERLNALGYSSRVKNSDEGGYTTRPFTVDRFAIDESLLDRQLAALPQGTTSPAHTPLTPEERLAGSVPLSAVVAQMKSSNIAGAAATSASIRKVDPIIAQMRDRSVFTGESIAELNKRILVTGAGRSVVNFAKCQKLNDPRLRRQANWDIGDPSVLEGHIHNSFTVSGKACTSDPSDPAANNTNVTIKATTDTGGTVLGYPVDLLRLEGALGGDQRTNTLSGELDVFIAGQDILHLSPSANVPTYTDNGGVEGDLGDPSFSGIVSILDLIDLDYTIGVHGTAGVNYHIGLSPLNVGAGVTPFVTAQACADAGIGIGTELIGVTAGAGGCVMVVNADINVGMGGGLGADKNGAFAANASLFANFDVDMLDGSVFLYAQYYTPCIDIPPWCRHRAQLDIFSWPGISYSDTFINEQISVPIE